MNYRTALAGVFDKYKNPRTRSHAVAFLERYADSGRPVTAWHAVGEDADAVALLLAGLGLEEKKDFTVTRSALDPSAARFGWTDAGVDAMAAVARELGAWRGDIVQRHVLCPVAGVDPLDLVDDVNLVVTDAGTEGQANPNSVVAQFADTVKRVAEQVMTMWGSLSGDDRTEAQSWSVAWARAYLANFGSADTSCNAPPAAPLAVLETLARAEGAVTEPSFQVFDAVSACDTLRIVARPLGMDEALTPAARVNCMPLEEQFCGGCSTALGGYFATTVRELPALPGVAGLWLQFDEPICRTAEALNFALDAERMRRLAVGLFSRYHGLNCHMLDTTRLGLHNEFGGVPGNDDLTDDDGETSSMQYRMCESNRRADSVLYMGGCVLTPLSVPLRDWSVGCMTSPVRTDCAPTDEGAAAACGVTSEELAAEWFFAVHGGETWSRNIRLREPNSERRTTRVRNLSEFRCAFRELDSAPETMRRLCGPDNPSFSGDASIPGGPYLPPGAFVNGVCAALRYSAGEAGAALEFVQSPFHPNKMVAGVWTGLSTDLAPTLADEAAIADVFPQVDYCGIDGEHRWRDDPSRRADMTKLLALLRERPSLQLRFGKRTKGVHRKHVILVETNVNARHFLEHADLDLLRQSAWLAFASTMLYRHRNPIASVDADSAQVGRAETPGFEDWVRDDTPDWYQTLHDQGSYEASRPAWPRFQFGWREDDLGRLVLVFQTGEPAMALRAKVAWRYEMCLPVQSAAYAAARGAAQCVDLSGVEGDVARYHELIKAAMHQPGFAWDFRTTSGQRGRFGTIWAMNPVWDLDSDEIPCRTWYLADPCHVTVRGLDRDAGGEADNPF